MLLTPPEHYGAHRLPTSSCMPPFLYTAPAPASHFDADAFDYDGFTQPGFRFDAAPQPPQTMDAGLRQSSNRLPPVQKPVKSYHPVGAPALPPVRVPEGSMGEFQHAARSSRPAPHHEKKEEKTGGVTAHLDYEMDEMVDFVAEMTQGMYAIFLSKICLADIDLTRSVLSSNAPVHPTFRKFVSQVLASTRLPSSTILGSLHYLAIRMTIFSNTGNHNFGGGDLYNLLTTALLLGSKFLDDNTFQNRSWSDVSNIPVKFLNKMESEWLKDIKWDLHFDPSDPKGFGLWRRRWETYRARKMDTLAESMKQACLDNRFPRQPYSPPSLSPHAQYPSAFAEPRNPNVHADRLSFPWQPSQYDRWTPHVSQSEYSPPSAPETGPATPDHAMSGGFGYSQFPPLLSGLKLPPALVMVPNNSVPSGFPTPYTAHCSQQAAYGNYCCCQYCLPGNDRFMTGPVYTQTAYTQSVVG